jgi:phospholipid/cholesterol/gamma-HCH transport system substrate-binding protein
MKRRNEVLVGLFLTIGITVLLIGTIWLTRGALTSGYRLYANFPWGAGLKQGQPVLLAGVSVGFVDQVELKREGTILVTMRIKKQFKIPEGTSATVEPNGLFGDMLVALRPTKVTEASISPNDTVPMGKPQPTMADLLFKADSIAASAVDLTTKVQVEMVKGGGISDLRQTIASTHQLVLTLTRLAELQSQNLSSTMTTVRGRVAAVDSVQLDSIVRNVNRTATHADSLALEMRRTTAHLDALLAKLDSTNGTAGKLLNDTLLYHDVRTLVARLDSLTADFKKNPKKYVKLSIF